MNGPGGFKISVLSYFYANATNQKKIYLSDSASYSGRGWPQNIPHLCKGVRCILLEKVKYCILYGAMDVKLVSFIIQIKYMRGD